MHKPAALAPMFSPGKTIEELAALGFLVRYKGDTRYRYTSDLRFFFEWCSANGLPPLDAQRVHLELYARHLEDVRATARRRCTASSVRSAASTASPKPTAMS